MAARPSRARRFAPALALLALWLAPAPARAASVWDEIPAEAWNEPARPDSGGANAVVILERDECRQNAESFEIDHFMRARVFTAAGRDVGTVEILYFRKEWKLSGVRARAVRPGGAAIELDPATIVTTTVWKTRDAELLKATVNVPGVEPGCIVEVAYTLSGADGYDGGWRFRFSSDYYTCLSTHTWRVPRSAWTGRQPGVKYANAFTIHIDEVREPDEKRPESITFSARGIPGVRDEPFAPPSSDSAPRVDVRSEGLGSDPTVYWSWWKRIFDLYQEALVKDSRKLETRVASFRSGGADTLAALREAYGWLQRNLPSNEELDWPRRPDGERIRNGYRFAERVDQLFDRPEASSLEINALLVAFAARLGLRANLGLAGDRRYGRFDVRSRGFPTGDYLTVVWLRDGPLFLQPSSRFAAFGVVPWYLRGGDCLLSGGGTVLFTRVPVDAGGTARSVWDLDLTLGEDGELDGRVSARLSGESAGEWKRWLWEADPAHWTATVAERLAENGGPKASVEPLGLGAAGDSAFAFDAGARWPGVAVVGGDRIEVPLDRLVPWRTSARFLLARRTVPVLFRYPHEELLRLRLRLPAGAKLDALPSVQEFHSEIGDWRIEWTPVSGGVRMERRVELHHGEVPIRSYAQVREFFDGLEAADRVPLQVTKGP